MKRTKLAHRLLPSYTRGEEMMNMVTHIVGGGLAIVGLILCVCKAALHGTWQDILGAVIYGVSMIALYTMSSVYHGLHASTGKKVLQILDHCTIYLLIAGTYTPIAISVLAPSYPVLGWGMVIFQWGMTALAITLTAIDLRKFRVFSMICYIGMGWAILPFWRQCMEVMTSAGFQLLLWGGISYTVGAIMYGIGSKKRWFHAVFHIFVLIGSILQFFAVYLFAL